MMSLGQVAEVTSVHLDTQAAPRQGHLELPLTRSFMVPVASLAQPSQVTPRPLPSSMLPRVTAQGPTSRRTRRRTLHVVQNLLIKNLKGGLHRMICF